MAFDWSEFLDVARSLAGEQVDEPSEEAKSRAATSRAYYAAFCSARNHLKNIDDVKVPATNAHQIVREKYKNASYDGERVKIGNQLNQLGTYRNHADYHDQYDDSGGWLRERAQSLKLSARILASLQNLGSPERS